MGIQKVKDYLAQFDAQDSVYEFEVSSATVELAAQALDVEPARIAKTLSFATKDGCVLILTAGDRKIDNSKFKQQFGEKAKMLSANEVEETTGHPVGGVCPFAVREGVRVFLDVSLQRFDAVYPAAGSANSAVRMTCDELQRCSRSLGWIDVCKPVAQ